MGVVRLHSANPCIRIRLLQLGHTSNEKNTHSLRVRFEPFQSYTKLTKDKKSRNALKPHTLFQHVDWTQHMIQHTESHALSPPFGNATSPRNTLYSHAKHWIQALFHSCLSPSSNDSEFKKKNGDLELPNSTHSLSILVLRQLKGMRTHKSRPFTFANTRAKCIPQANNTTSDWQENTRSSALNHMLNPH